MIFLSSLLINSSLASPVLVGKTIGLSKISQSYEISEELMDKLHNEYDFDVSLSQKTHVPSWIVNELSPKKQPTLAGTNCHFLGQKRRTDLVRCTKGTGSKHKKVTGESWEEVRAKLPTSLLS